MLKYSGSSWKSTTKWRTSSAGGFFCTGLAVIILVFSGTAQTDTAEADQGNKGTQDSVVENTGEDTLEKGDTLRKDTSDSSTSGSDTSDAADSSEGDSLAQDTTLEDTLDQVSDSFTVESEDSIEEYIRSIEDDTLFKDSAETDPLGGSSAEEGRTGITEEQDFTDYLKSRLKGIYLLVKPVLSILLLFLIIVIPAAGVYFLIRRAKESRKFLTTTRLSIMDKQIQRACHYIEKNYQNKDLSVQDICNELVIGATFLENLFQKELGMGVQDFINQVRINRALQIIDETPGSENQSIAFDCGYSSEDDFREVFKTITHVSVDEYRKSMNKQDL